MGGGVGCRCWVEGPSDEVGGAEGEGSRGGVSDEGWEACGRRFGEEREEVSPISREVTLRMQAGGPP